MSFYKYACIFSVIILFSFHIHVQPLYAAPGLQEAPTPEKTLARGTRVETIMPRMLAPALLAVPLGNEKYGDFLAVQKGAMLGAQSLSPSVDSADSGGQSESGGEESQVPLDYDGDGDVDIRDINIFRYILFNVYFFNNYYNSIPVWSLTTNVFVTPQLQTPWRDQSQHYKIEVPFVMPVQFSINQYLGLLANPALTSSTATMTKMAPVTADLSEKEKEDDKEFNYTFFALLEIARQSAQLSTLYSIRQLSIPAAGIFGDMRNGERLAKSQFSVGLEQKTKKAREALATEYSIAVLLTENTPLKINFGVEDELFSREPAVEGFTPLPQAVQYDGR